MKFKLQIVLFPPKQILSSEIRSVDITAHPYEFVMEI